MKRFILCILLCCAVVLSGCGDRGAASASESSSSGDFSALCMTYLQKFGRDFPNRNAVPSGTDAGDDNTHDEALDYIASELQAAGYTQVERVPFTSELGSGEQYDGTNLVLTIPGTDSSKQVIAGAHYDGDGCGDNGSGVALLLAAAVGLRGRTPGQTVKLIFFDCEEAGDLGSTAYVQSMSDEDAAKTAYYINIDSVAFGDYCNLYGGVEEAGSASVTQTGAYDLAMKRAAALGFKTCGTDALDGYYAKNGQGPAIEDRTVYTNPWTAAHPAPKNGDYLSPSTGDWGDHAPFAERGIPYVYFEATNWYAAGDGGDEAYTGYFETTDRSVGQDGMFMNTEYDTWDNLSSIFPGRALRHYQVFSPLLTSLLLDSGS